MVDISKPARASDEDIGRRRAPACLPVGSPAERLSEIAEILAAGLMRLWTRKSSQISPDGGESLLDCHGHQSGHADVQKSHGGSD